MLHAWWSNRITLKTVLPLLEDARINQVHNKYPSRYEQCEEGWFYVVL